MDTPMTIEEFNVLLSSEEEDSPLLAALRKLMTIEKPEDITALPEDDLVGWENWESV